MYSNLDNWVDIINIVLGYGLNLAANLNNWLDQIILFKINDAPVCLPVEDGALLVVWSDTTLFDDLNVPWEEEQVKFLSFSLYFEAFPLIYPKTQSKQKIVESDLQLLGGSVC